MNNICQEIDDAIAALSSSDSYASRKATRVLDECKETIQDRTLMRVVLEKLNRYLDDTRQQKEKNS